MRNNLKQIGLALLAFENDSGYFPQAFRPLPTPDPAAPSGTGGYGASAFVLILPYLEQRGLYGQINIAKAALNPANMPPNNPAYSTAINTFICPSAPGYPTTDYAAELSNSFNNFGVNVSFPPGLIFGRTDYAPDAGMQADIPGISINAGASIIAEPPDGPVPPRKSPTACPARSWWRKTRGGRVGTGATARRRRPGYTPAAPTGERPAARRGSLGRPARTTSPPTAATRRVRHRGRGGFMGMPAAPWTCGERLLQRQRSLRLPSGGSNIVFGDGSVQFVMNGLTMNQIQALLSRAGGDSLTSLTKETSRHEEGRPVPGGGAGAGLCLVQQQPSLSGFGQGDVPRFSGLRRTVFFHRQGGDAMNDDMIMGIVQEDGSFGLVGGLPGKGIPPGEYDVVIEWKQAGNRGQQRRQQGPDKLKGRYADAKRPLLHAMVEAKATTLPPFELTD